MIHRPEQKSPEALRGRRPGGSLRHKESYPVRAELQASGEHFATAWINTAERFLSACWHGIADRPHGPLISVIVREAAALTLERGDFPSVEAWNLLACFHALAADGIAPTPRNILSTARLAGLHLPVGGGDPVAEIEGILWLESSAALLVHRARMLKAFASKARQVARLWRTLADRIADPFGEVSRPTPVVVKLVRPARTARRTVSV